MGILLKIIKFIAKITLFLILLPIILMLIVMLITINIRYYDYGINTKETNLPFSAYFNIDQGKYDFSTVLLTKNGGFKHQSDALIYILHMDKALREENNIRTSTIYFNKFKVTDFHIKEIMLEHKTLDGNIIIPYKNNLNEFTQCMEISKYNCEYKQIYKDLPKLDKIIENIEINFIIDGKTQTLSKSYPIEYKWHTSLWDSLMRI